MTLAEIKRRKVRDAYQDFLGAAADYMEYVVRHPTSLESKHSEIHVVQIAVADHYKLHISSMTTKTKTRELSLPRQVAMSIVREATRYSFAQIGDAFGRRDHGTAIFAQRAVAARISIDPLFKQEYASLKRKCEKLIENAETPLFAIGA